LAEAPLKTEHCKTAKGARGSFRARPKLLADSR
jgi:hypothetical protein